ncbi:MAG: type II toxin-antitoxin system VapC family toxin [Chloroflexota bacterium]
MPDDRLDRALGDAERVLLDTSTLVAFHTRRELAHDPAKSIFARIQSEDDALTGYYSVVSATELLVRPMRAGLAESAYMHAFLRHFPHLHALPVDLDVATQGATLRAIKNLKTPDALIVASGVLAGCDAIVTNDEEWKRKLAPLFREFRWIYLGDYLAP